MFTSVRFFSYFNQNAFWHAEWTCFIHLCGFLRLDQKKKLKQERQFVQSTRRESHFFQKKKVTFLKAVLHEALMSIEKLVFMPFSQSSMYESVILNDWHKTWCLPLMFLKPCKLLCDCTGTNISTWCHSVNRALKDSKRFMANRNILMLKCWRVVQEWWRGLFFFILYDVTMTFLVPRQGIFLLCNRPNERCSTYQ